MASIFSLIAAGQIPSYKVAEDENYYAFLDINPLAKGHTLVIPKKEVDYIFDLDDETYAGLCAFAKKVAVALKEAAWQFSEWKFPTHTSIWCRCRPRPTSISARRSSS